jgi:hypothetical protein
MFDEIKFRLAHFVDFNGGSNHVADVYIKWDLGIRHAWFDLRGFPCVPSWLLNGNPVPMQICCNPAGGVRRYSRSAYAYRTAALVGYRDQ